MNIQNIERELILHLKCLGESHETIKECIAFMCIFLKPQGFLEEFGNPDALLFTIPFSRWGFFIILGSNFSGTIRRAEKKNDSNVTWIILFIFKQV